MEDRVLVNMSTLTDMANSVRTVLNTTNLMSITDLSTSISQMGPKMAVGILNPSNNGYIVVNHNLGRQPQQVGIHACYTGINKASAPTVNRNRFNSTATGGTNAISMVLSSCCNLLNSRSQSINVYFYNRSNRVINNAKNSSSSSYNSYYYNVTYTNYTNVYRNASNTIATANNAFHISTINETSFTTPNLSKHADYIWYAF